MDALVFRSATELASAIRNKEASSKEVIEAHFRHIHRHNEKLNALVLLNEEAALARAGEADAALSRGELWGPLHGVPITVKDAIETAGLTTTSSYEPLRNHVPSRNATVVQCLVDAGAIILGKTNLPELAMQVQTNGKLHGRANNPWDLTRTPGGSTGGGAAALAAGLTPLELGSDLAGSIRIPAHFCGVLGHKPTVGSVSLEGHIPPLPGTPQTLRSVAVTGPLARTVDDLALTMHLIHGTGFRDIGAPAVALDEEAPTSLRGLKIAWYDDFGGVPVTQDTIDGLEAVAETLRNKGCRVEWTSPPNLHFEALWETYGRIAGSGIAASMPAFERFMGYCMGKLMMGRDPLLCNFLMGLDLNMRLFNEAMQKREHFMATTASFFEKWDAWLCPVSATPAVPHQVARGKRPYDPVSVDGVTVPYWTASIAHAVVPSLLGNPVTVIPLTHSEEGLPIGVQVTGKRWKDIKTLAIAKLIMEANGPVSNPPGYEYV